MSFAGSLLFLHLSNHTLQEDVYLAFRYLLVWTFSMMKWDTWVQLITPVYLLMIFTDFYIIWWNLSTPCKSKCTRHQLAPDKSVEQGRCGSDGDGETLRARPAGWTSSHLTASVNNPTPWWLGWFIRKPTVSSSSRHLWFQASCISIQRDLDPSSSEHRAPVRECQRVTIPAGATVCATKVSTTREERQTSERPNLISA